MQCVEVLLGSAGVVLGTIVSHPWDTVRTRQGATTFAHKFEEVIGRELDTVTLRVAGGQKCIIVRYNRALWSVGFVQVLKIVSPVDPSAEFLEQSHLGSQNT